MSVPRVLAAAISLISMICALAQSAPPPQPKLVVGIIADQFRYDYLTRFRSEYHGGLDRMLREGADFTNGFYAQVPTVTAVGHSIFMSGAMPAVSGIIANNWYDRDSKKVVTSVCDWDEKTVGSERPDVAGASCTDADPASPRRFLVTTFGDELRNSHAESKVIGISIKARGAILPSGHRAAGAFWFDGSSGDFVTSTYYMPDLPAWAKAFNDRKLPAKYVDQPWEGFPNWNFHAAANSKEKYGQLDASPWGNELIEQFTEAAIDGEKLGQRGVTDLLTVSFSSNDYVGHRVGPDAPEVRDMCIRTDQQIGKLFRLLDQRVGLRNVIVVFSADHGAAATAEQAKVSKSPGGVLSAHLTEVVSNTLTERFGQANWILSNSDAGMYLNHDAMDKLKTADGKAVARTEVVSVAKQVILSAPQLHVVRVYTADELEVGVTGDFIARAEMNGHFSRRSGDLFLVFEPGYIPSATGTTHFSPYNYDRHVPILFMGPGIKAGRYDATIEPNDIAPTLATMLNVQTPSGSSGRVLTEMLQR